eukprot:9801234-Karenia_brevis.AAC.1
MMTLKPAFCLCMCMLPVQSDIALADHHLGHHHLWPPPQARVQSQESINPSGAVKGMGVR